MLTFSKENLTLDISLLDLKFEVRNVDYLILMSKTTVRLHPKKAERNDST